MFGIGPAVELLADYGPVTQLDCEFAGLLLLETLMFGIGPAVELLADYGPVMQLDCEFAQHGAAKLIVADLLLTVLHQGHALLVRIV